MALAQSPMGSSSRDIPSCTLEMTLEGVVAPGTLDYLRRGVQVAAEHNCRSILLNINTPGGNLQTTRLIVEEILSSPFPFLCLVGPPGGHAGSAGAIILLACHVAGAQPSTSIGAATPVSGTGETIPDDMRNKLIQDTQAWVKGLAQRYGRSHEFAEKIVTEALSLHGEEAFQKGAIDILAADKNQFLDQAEGRKVKMAGETDGTVSVGALMAFPPDTRHAFLQLITDPQFAYLLFMASLALLYFELTHPGTIVPGIAGGFGLITSLIAFHKLDVWWGGASLIALGLGLLLAEAFVPSFGALGVGGAVAVAVGSFLLYDPSVSGAVLPLWLIIITSGVLALLMIGLGLFVIRNRVHGKAIPEKAILDRVGEVVSLEAPSLRRGMVFIDGENWRFVSEKDLKPGDRVRVLDQDGLTLKVKPEV